MLPPSDSFTHNNLKLAEALASFGKQVAVSAPPPPYAATAAAATAAVVEGYDDEGDEDFLAPIVIKIDTSISIDGQNNTVAIPTSMGPGVEDGQSSPAEVPSPGLSVQQQLQLLQQRRQAKSAQLASAIISALKAAGALDDLDTGRQRPIEIDVNAGIRITGSSNVICPGKKTVTDSSSSTSDEENARKRRAQSEPLSTVDSKRLRTT